MQIIRDINYLQKLQSIMEFIAQDSLNQAIKFQIDLDEIIMIYQICLLNIENQSILTITI